MIWSKWIEPNFKFLARDKEGKEYNYFCHAENDGELRKRLEAQNLTVATIEQYDFSEWRRRAAQATQRAVEAHNAGKRLISFRSSIWAELKWHLFDLFHGKCAYCESKTFGIAAYGDVEHYRPKGKVDEDRSHPGYYWLAYDEKNLLPSCGPCNQTRGKMTHFPVASGTSHARRLEEIGNESPLLLNPYNRNVDLLQHLEFTEVGEAIAHDKSEYGEQSRQFYHLNRWGLSEARRSALSQVEQDWDTLTIRLASLQKAYDTLRSELILGAREYSAAQLYQLERTKKQRLTFLAATPGLPNAPND